MRIRALSGCVLAATVVAAPQAVAVSGEPITQREGVVLAWNPGAKTAVVVTANRRVYVVHALRRYTPGTRVRVDGVKWGAPVSGVKWGTAPQGVKWGIKLARNGTYQSGLTIRRGKATTMALRAKVLRRVGRTGVAVSFRGATVVLPVARGAVWLPGGGTRVKAAGGVGALGSTSVFTLRIASSGRVIVTRAREVAPAAPNAAVPFSGVVTAQDTVNRTVTIQASTVRSLPVLLTVTVPVGVDLALYPVGTQVAGTVVPAAAPGTELFLTGLSVNRGFAAADSPLTTVTTTPPDPADMAAIAAAEARWKAGFDAGRFTAQGDGLFESQAQRLARVERLIAQRDDARAIEELEKFEDVVGEANGSGQPSQAKIDPAFQAGMIAESAALRGRLKS